VTVDTTLVEAPPVETPPTEIDVLKGLIANLRRLLTALDGTAPIVVSVGKISQEVSPTVAPVAYQQGADFLKILIAETILTYRNRIADLVLSP
jgi:hypothetical protein